MPELRKDPVVGRWVIIATERARRPGNIVDRRKIFDEDREATSFSSEDKEIYLLKSRKKASGENPWKVRVMPSKNPLLSLEKKNERRGHGLYDVINGYGAHEVILDTPDQVANMADLEVGQIRSVIMTYARRFKELSKNSNLEYIFVYKNYGGTEAEEEVYSNSQLIAAPVIPLHIKEKLQGAKKYFDFHERCVYSDLVQQESEMKQRVLTETDQFLAIMPFASRFLFETWIIPKKQHCDFAQGVAGHEGDLAKILKDVLSRIKAGLDDPPYTLVINSAPLRGKKSNGNSWKTIEEDFCWHIEITPTLTRVAGFEKGTGFYICPIPPEETAEFLKTAK